MSNLAPIYVFATLDTKFDEANFLADALRAEGVQAVLIDVGTLNPPTAQPGIDRATVAAFHPEGAGAVLGHTDRGTAVTAMSRALRSFMIDAYRSGRCSGAIGLGGTGGTSMIATAMRGLPIGFPKLMVSTVASGDTSSYIGTSDITMMFSVVDVAGLNRVSRQIYRNAAAAIAGMARLAPAQDEGQRALGLTMFGVTTPCVTSVREILEPMGYDTLVFHATGVGGRAMEELAGSDMLDGVLDITTTEVADEVVGGVFACGPARFDVMLERRMPYVLSVGALDMVNFGPLDSVPQQFRDRNLYVHNSSVTLMRTTVEENIACARWIARKLNAHPDAGFTLLIPEGGVSAIDKPGGPFHDPEADAALFAELESAVAQGPTRRIVRYPHHINDPEFAQAIVDEYRKVMH
ncbi:Tm-1-like ATP-binding domain-containing protein [Sphingomonas colocasiae]|uniref:Tm-1-like ATP-binding domain-containing protein n=1 Tax=Sphingomonas colocasiae TaxID=1848973 RepID=A0ABS7PHH8_9SPHN|nr:Tm-1-like ATP-binding domain-containing protein [Sphingomonas colocasiae]MBY8820748.1 Tm-1-like ATP-binding domain-containing protein [Sphingomonas colocasiae]